MSKDYLSFFTLMGNGSNRTTVIYWMSSIPRPSRHSARSVWAPQLRSMLPPRPQEPRLQAGRKQVLQNAWRLLDKILTGIKARAEDLAQAISQEMGAPISFARTAQVGTGIAHFATARQILASYQFEETRGSTQIVKETGRCVWHDYALELATEPAYLQSRARPCNGLHNGAETQRTSAYQRYDSGRNHS
jgi:hypothetical protein